MSFDFINLARKAMTQKHKLDIEGLRNSIEEFKKKIENIEQLEVEHLLLTDEQFVEKYPEKVKHQKDQFGENIN